MSQLTALGRTVRDGGRVVAELSYGVGIEVSLPDGTVIGRLYRTGKHTQLYDVWTARHPAVPTPSDTRLAESLPLTEAVALLLNVGS